MNGFSTFWKPPGSNGAVRPPHGDFPLSGRQRPRLDRFSEARDEVVQRNDDLLFLGRTGPYSDRARLRLAFADDQKVRDLLELAVPDPPARGFAGPLAPPEASGLPPPCRVR